jgi:hypothetical protein
LDRRHQIDGALFGLCGSYGAGFGQIGSGARATAKSTQNRAACLCSGQCGAGPLANQSGFMLRESGQDMNGQPVRQREIDRFERDVSVQKAGNEGHIPSKPVQLSNHECGFMDAAICQSGGKLRTVTTTPAFDFRELADEFCAVQVGLDRLLLSLNPQPATALADGADPVISYEPIIRSIGHGLLLCVQRWMHSIIRNTLISFKFLFRCRHLHQQHNENVNCIPVKILILFNFYRLFRYCSGR